MLQKLMLSSLECPASTVVVNFWGHPAINETFSCVESYTGLLRVVNSDPYSGLLECLISLGSMTYPKQPGFLTANI